MRISIVTPVYNEEKNLKRYFSTIKKIDYPCKDFEIILVNDGSKDKSLDLIKKLKSGSKQRIKVIDLGRNKGRSIARETGAKKTKYETILFLDAKCEIFPSALNEIKKLNYDIISCHIIQKQNNIIDTFFFLARKKLYKQEKNIIEGKTFITPQNFDSMAKGTTMFLCNKNLFLNSQIDNKESKNSSDDTKLLWNIVQKKKILKTKKIKAYYNTRQELWDNINHIYNRGPKFVDYYYTPSKKWFWIVNTTLLIGLLLTFLTIKGIFIREILITLIILDTIMASYLGGSIKSFLITLFLFPCISVIFLSGIIRGIIIKATSK